VAFLTNKGLVEPKVTYFWLCNLLETLQWMINSIFQELLYKGVLANYMNDFVIPTKTKNKLEERTIWFLKIAEKHNLCFKQSKYDFNAREIPILEIVVRWGEVQIEKNKVKTVKEWKIPTNKRSRKLLRVCKFLQKLYQKLQLYSKTS